MVLFTLSSMWIRLLLATLLALFFTKNMDAAVISEVLPNTENDTLLEYITLKNNSCVPEDISLYSLTDVSGKEFLIPSGTIIPSFSEQKFFRPETKITLNNENESLFLRNTSGTLLDTFSYVTSIKNTVIFQTVSNEMCVPTSGSGTVDSGSGVVTSGSGAVDPEDDAVDSGNSTDSDTSGDSTEYSDPVE